MSGPVSTVDAGAEASTAAPEPAAVEITPSRDAEVGRFRVRRALPRRSRRTVGAWCFVDHMGPGSVTEQHGLDIGPHPHIGLQTVTWLLEGEVLHRDSIGSEQPIRPGQLNLMTAGRGIAHSEEATGSYRGTLEGVQLWVAQPSATRDGDSAFEHHATLPRVELEGCSCTVFVGAFGDEVSPARRDTDHVGVDLDARPGRHVLPVERAFEYALVVVRGALTVDGQLLEPGHLGYLGIGRDELVVTTAEPTRAVLLGGTPFPEPVLMWWNYVARTRDEITEAHRAWFDRDGRFGEVRSALARMEVGAPPWSE